MLVRTVTATSRGGPADPLAASSSAAARAACIIAAPPAAWLGALALSSSATLLLPVAVKHMIDQGFSAGGSVDRWFALLFGVAVMLALATAARFYFVSLLGERVVADLRRSLYGHLLSQD